MELLGKTNIDFIGKRNIAFVISAIVSIIGIIGIIQIARGEANMGIDFSGGTSMQLKFTKPLAIADARAALHKNGIAKAELQEIKEGNQLLIKIDKNTSLALGKAADAVQAAFKKEFADNVFTVESSTEIGPSIGDKRARTPWWRWSSRCSASSSTLPGVSISSSASVPFCPRCTTAWP